MDNGLWPGPHPCLPRLKAEFGTDPDSGCSAEELAMGHAATGFLIIGCISVDSGAIVTVALIPLVSVRNDRTPPGPRRFPLQIRPPHV